MAAGADLGIAEFAHPGIFDLGRRAEPPWSACRSISEHRIPSFEDRSEPGSASSYTEAGPPGEDDAARREAADEFLVDVEGMQLAVDLRLPDAARDQLRILRAEVEDEDLVVHYSTW